MEILMVCSGGMSSSMVVKGLEKEADKEGLDANVKAVGTGEYENELSNNWDIILVAPQVKHRLDYFEEKAKEVNLPVLVIQPEAYSPIGSDMLLKQVREKLNV